MVGAGRVGGKHTQTPTTAADRQPDGKKGRLKIDLGPSLADASDGVRVEQAAEKARARSRNEKRALARFREATGGGSGIEPGSSKE